MEKNQSGYPFARAHRRMEVNGSVYIHNDEHLYIAPLKNLGAGGAFVGSLISLLEGSLVRVTIKSPHLDAPVQAVGKVVRVENDSRRGLAVQFTSISTRSKKAIETCVLDGSGDCLRVA